MGEGRHVGAHRPAVVREGQQVQVAGADRGLVVEGAEAAAVAGALQVAAEARRRAVAGAGDQALLGGPGGQAHRAAVVGFGITGRSVAQALQARGIEPIVVDDAPGDDARDAARRLGVDLHAAPSADDLRVLIEGSRALFPTPGLPDRHPAMAVAAASGTPVLSEFDLARQWDDRPIVAVTGTNGKTTVTTMVTDMLNGSGSRAEAVGNTDVPLVEAIDDPGIETFVVEASSFRLGHSEYFAPAVATWLNFSPDHLNVHASLDAYEQAKARIWADQAADDVAVATMIKMSSVAKRAMWFAPSDERLKSPGSPPRRSISKRAMAISGAFHVI